MRGQNRPINGNHVKPRPARDQNIQYQALPLLTRELMQWGEPGYEARQLTMCSSVASSPSTGPRSLQLIAKACGGKSIHTVHTGVSILRVHIHAYCIYLYIVFP